MKLIPFNNNKFNNFPNFVCFIDSELISDNFKDCEYKKC